MCSITTTITITKPFVQVFFFGSIIATLEVCGGVEDYGLARFIVIADAREGGHFGAGRSVIEEGLEGICGSRVVGNFDGAASGGFRRMGPVPSSVLFYNDGSLAT